MDKNYVVKCFVNEGMALGLEKGRDEGIKQGLEKGHVEGARAAARRALLQVLSRRFGDLGEDTVRRIEKIEDPGELERLVGEAAVAASLETFLDLLA